MIMYSLLNKNFTAATQTGTCCWHKIVYVWECLVFYGKIVGASNLARTKAVYSTSVAAVVVIFASKSAIRLAILERL